MLAGATAPLGLGLLAFVALVPLLQPIAANRSPADAALAGGACGVVYFGLGFLEFPWNLGEPLLWGAFAIAVPWLAGSLALLASALALLARRGSGTALAAAPALWAVLELVRCEGPVGLPWLRLADAVAEWPTLIQGAAFGGATLVSAWIAAVNAAATAMLIGGRRWAWAPLLVLGFGASLASRLPLYATPPPVGVRVGAIQPAVPSAERFSDDRFATNLERLLALSLAARREAPDLIAWPEGAWPRWAGAEGEPFLGAIANSLDTPVLSGVRRKDREGGWRWNSVALGVPGGITRVAGDKVAPLPLYERAPETGLARALAQVVAWPGVVRAAREPGIADVPTARGGSVRVGILICIDAAHPALARGLRRRGAELLLGVANEAESGSWSARQQAAIVRLRAVETGLALVRVANTGPSLWVDAWGREIARLEAGREAFGVATAPPPLRPPLYVAIGDAPVLAALFAPALASLVSRRRAPAAASRWPWRHRPFEGRTR